MHDIDNESLEKWKDSFAKEGVVYDSDEEYYEAIHNLTGFLDILVEIDRTSKHSTEDSVTDEMHLLDKDGNKIIL